MKYAFAIFVSLIVNGVAFCQHSFSSVDSLLNYAVSKSITLQSGDIKLQQAQKAKLAAILGVPDVTGGGYFSYTNNTKLPVNLFPAEIFGGQAGTFREVQTGVQYNTNFNQNLDIKLLNLKGWENVKLAKLNIAAATADNKLTLKTLLENIAATYFNIVSLQQQLVVTKQNLQAADSLLAITSNKYQEGLAKQQDVNDAKVNVINTGESIQQLQFLITQQYLALKILCDVNEQEEIHITEVPANDTPATTLTVDTNFLAYQNSVTKQQVALSSYKQQKYSLYPHLSFFQSYTTQQFNTSSKFFNNNVNWIPSSYIGLKLSVPIPGANAIAQTYKAKYDYLLAKQSSEQEKIKTGVQTKQLSVAYDKAFSQLAANRQVYVLRKDTYEKNLNLYREGLQSFEFTLTSFNSMVNAWYNVIAAKALLMLAKTNIDINNRVK
jgi:outer membrane protein TolC